MPKRSSDHEQSPTTKRTRSSSNTTRKSTADKAPESSSSQLQRRRTLSTVAPSQISDSRPENTDTRSLAATQRRMNPDSLAGRLGPGLIRELEALLKPGTTEMPPFSVRQEIQQRYNIDRRHIYDWFHNKGLRVSSSEKRDEKREQKQKELRKPLDTRIQRKIRSYQDEPEPLPASQPPLPRNYSRTSTPGITASSRPTPSPVSSNLLSYEAACHMQRYPVQPFGEYYDTSVFPHHQLLAYPQMHSVTHGHYFFPVLPEYHGAPSSIGDSIAKLPADRTSDWISEQQRIPYTPGPVAPSPSLGTQKTHRDSLNAILPLDNEQTLPQTQRQAFYQSLSEVLPPACGIEESVGSYKAYMTQQVQGYYDRFASNDSAVPGYEYYSLDHGVPPVSAVPTVYPSHGVYSTQAGPHQAHGAPVPPGGEFSHWLLYGGRSQAASVAPSPSQTPSLSEAGTSMSSVLWRSDVPHEHARDRTGVPSLDMHEILESPVLRSRHATIDFFGETSPHPHRTQSNRKQVLYPGLPVKLDGAAQVQSSLPLASIADAITNTPHRYRNSSTQPVHQGKPDLENLEPVQETVLPIRAVGEDLRKF